MSNPPELGSYDTSRDAIQHTYIDWLERTFDTTGGRTALQDQEPQTFHGVRFSYANGNVRLDIPMYRGNPSLRSPKARRTWGYNCGRPILALNKDILGPEAGCSPGKIILMQMALKKSFYLLATSIGHRGESQSCRKIRIFGTLHFG